MERVIKSSISHLTITKNRARSNQLNKVLKAISAIYQDKDYAYIPDIIHSNIKPTQDYFLSEYLIKRQHTPKHYVKQGITNPFIGLDMPSSNSPINPAMVENTLIFNSNPQDQQCINYNHESIVKSQEWDEYIANKKTVMKFIFDLCDEEAKPEIPVNSSCKGNMKIGDLINFFIQMRKICNDAKDETVFFETRLSNIT